MMFWSLPKQKISLHTNRTTKIQFFYFFLIFWSLLCFICEAVAAHYAERESVGVQILRGTADVFEWAFSPFLFKEIFLTTYFFTTISREQNERFDACTVANAAPEFQKQTPLINKTFFFCSGTLCGPTANVERTHTVPQPSDWGPHGLYDYIISTLVYSLRFCTRVCYISPLLAQEEVQLLLTRWTHETKGLTVTTVRHHHVASVLWLTADPWEDTP